MIRCRSEDRPVLPMVLTGYRKGDLFRALHRLGYIGGAGCASWPKIALVSMAEDVMAGGRRETFAAELKDARRRGNERLREAKRRAAALGEVNRG